MDSIEIAKAETLSAFAAQRVSPSMLSQSTLDLINASGGGTITNLADDEDLTTVDNAIKLADRAYSPSTFSGKGYKILRKNVVGSQNILTQAMVSDANTVYEIRYDFDLNGAAITIPEGCTLKFDGGSISNGTVAGNGTLLEKDIKMLCHVSGSFANESLNIKWFVSYADGIDISSLLAELLAMHSSIYLPKGSYTLSQPVTVTDHKTIYGDGFGLTNIIVSDSVNCFVGTNVAYTNLLDFSFYVSNAVSTEIVKYNGAQHCNFRLDFNSLQRYEVANYTAILLHSTSASVYVAYNHIEYIRCRGCRIGLHIKCENAGWITTNVFKYAFITAFSYMGVCIEKDSSSPIFANEFNIIVQDGINSANDRYGVKLSGYENKINVTSWADATESTNKYYALYLTLPTNTNVRNEIYGYVEGLIYNSAYLPYYDAHFSQVTLDRSNSSASVKVFKAHRDIVNCNLFDSRYLESESYLYSKVGQVEIISNAFTGNKAMKIIPASTEKATAIFRFSRLLADKLRAFAIVKSSNASSCTIFLDNAGGTFVGRPSIAANTYTVISTAYSDTALSSSFTNLTIRNDNVGSDFEICFVGIFKVDDSDASIDYSIDNLFNAKSLPIETNVRRNQIGATAERPSLVSSDEGFEYYDSTLKKKILWNGTAWVNVDGSALA